MAPWTPIVPKSIDVIGIHAQHHHLLVVRVTLSARPPTAWRKLLTALSMERDLAIDDEGITFHPTDDAMELAIEDLSDVIRRVNEAYAVTQTVPRAPSHPAMAPFSAMVELQETASPDTIARIIAARRRATGLSGVFQSSLWIIEAETKDTSGDK